MTGMFLTETNFESKPALIRDTKKGRNMFGRENIDKVFQDVSVSFDIENGGSKLQTIKGTDRMSGKTERRSISWEINLLERIAGSLGDPILTTDGLWSASVQEEMFVGRGA